MEIDLASPTAFSQTGHLATFVRGDGPPVAFLHAGVADSRMWQAQIATLAHSHRAIAYDRRGFGATPAADETRSDVGDLFAVLDEFADGRPAVIVGCSDGGRIAIDAALSGPSRVRALVLVAPSVSGAPPSGYPDQARATVEALEAAEKADDLDQVNEFEARLWLDGPLAAPGRIGGAPRRLFIDMNAIALGAPKLGRTLEAPPAYPRLREISMPTLVIWGSLEFPDIQARCRHLLHEIPGARAHVMSNVAHLPSLEQPAALTELIAGFIASLSEKNPPPR